jgi:hypothetical protein
VGSCSPRYFVIVMMQFSWIGESWDFRCFLLGFSIIELGKNGVFFISVLRLDEQFEDLLHSFQCLQCS